MKTFYVEIEWGRMAPWTAAYKVNARDLDEAMNVAKAWLKGYTVGCDINGKLLSVGERPKRGATINLFEITGIVAK